MFEGLFTRLVTYDFGSGKPIPDLFNQRLYKLAFGPGGRLPTSSTTLPLSGRHSYTPGAFNANGITRRRSAAGS